jgi:hypothetical protein
MHVRCAHSPSWPGHSEAAVHPPREEDPPVEELVPAVDEDAMSLVAPVDDAMSLVAPVDDAMSLVAPADDAMSLVAPVDDAMSLVAAAEDGGRVLVPADVAALDGGWDDVPMDPPDEAARLEDCGPLVREKLTADDDPVMLPELDDEDDSPDEEPVQPATTAMPSTTPNLNARMCPPSRDSSSVTSARPLNRASVARTLPVRLVPRNGAQGVSVGGPGPGGPRGPA